MEFSLRPFHQSDLVMLYRICLETGADGVDATGTIDPEVLGHFFAAPYAILEPALCTVLVADGVPCGYVLGTADSEAFRARAEMEWFPVLRDRYPRRAGQSDRESMMIEAFHRGYEPPPCCDLYPAHLHIDLLPAGQGHGWGPVMIRHFLGQLVARNISGVHLGVSKANERAMAFYPKLGFERIIETDRSVTYGLSLPAAC